MVAIAYAGGVDPTVASGINFGPISGSTVSATAVLPAGSGLGTPLPGPGSGPGGASAAPGGPVGLATTGIAGFSRATDARAGSSSPGGSSPGGTGPSGGPAAPSTAGNPRPAGDAVPMSGTVPSPDVTAPQGLHTTVSSPQVSRAAPPDPAVANPVSTQTSTLAAGRTGGSGPADGLGYGAAGLNTGSSAASSNVGSGGDSTAGDNKESAGPGRPAGSGDSTDSTTSGRGSHPTQSAPAGHGGFSPSFIPPDYPVVVADSTAPAHGHSGSRHSKSR